MSGVSGVGWLTIISGIANMGLLSSTGYYLYKDYKHQDGVSKQVDGNWSIWSGWSPCSQTCSGGSQYASRMCTEPPPANGGRDCMGMLMKTQHCNTEIECPVHGVWSKWEPVTPCTVRCDGGTQTVRRACNDPAPALGGTDCVGMDSRVAECNTHGCSESEDFTSVSIWSKWGACSRSCGAGHRNRTRSCPNPTPDHGCEEPIVETEECNTDPCPADGKWAHWSEWSECSKTCAAGITRRIRTCTDPPPGPNGKNCEGDSKEIEDCNVFPCPIDGRWTLWTPWSACTRPCGSGSSYRMRSCTNPPPLYEGEECEGHAEEMEDCNKSPCPIDGKWAAWSKWSECSKSCASGVTLRIRACTNPAPEHNGHHCYGDSRDIDDCNTSPCPIDGKWTLWRGWTTCSKTCDAGTKYRLRSCTNPPPLYDGQDCDGDSEEREECNSFTCPVDGKWTEWGKWTACSATCDTGARHRDRECSNPEPEHGGKSCHGEAKDVQDCNRGHCPIDGRWTNWSQWSDCSKSCDSGTYTRSRSCTNPPPLYNGNECQGEPEEVGKCNEIACSMDGKWTPWSEWSSCSKICGTGFTTRNRNCSNPLSPEDCVGDSKDMKDCNTDLCPIDGGWAVWNPWSACTKSCGLGINFRSRSCTNPTPMYNGKQCDGDATEVDECSVQSCPVNGNWAQWAAWSSCTRSCGTGISYRLRTCTDPAPKHNGIYCIGDYKETEDCNSHLCPINGHWTAWTAWYGCSRSCGTGTTYRARTCTNPPPLYGGKMCSGESKETGECNAQSCPVDGLWSLWSEWSSCSSSCGLGVVFRSHKCDDPAPQYGGHYCIGEHEEKKECDAEHCPIDGLWTAWTPWSSCTKSCASGLAFRIRTCSNPEPQYNGKYCLGEPSDTKQCNTNPCPVNGGFTPWSNWGSCSTSCGEGTKTRTRSCTNPMPQFGGDDCSGSLTGETQCSGDKCCPSGWIYYSPTKSCYRYVGTKHNYFRASSNCEDMGGQLASVHSREENDFVKGLFWQWSDTWFGLSPHTSSFKDKSRVSFTDYAPGEPNWSGMCGQYWAEKGLKWDDDNCIKSKPSVCKKPCCT